MYEKERTLEQKWEEAEEKYLCLRETYLPIGRMPKGFFTETPLKEIVNAQIRADKAHDAMVGSWSDDKRLC